MSNLGILIPAFSIGPAVEFAAVNDIPIVAE